VAARHPKDERPWFRCITKVQWRRRSIRAAADKVFGRERSSQDRSVGEARLVLEPSVSKTSRSEVPKLRRVSKATFTDLCIEGTGSLRMIHVDVETAIRPFAGQALALAELDVHLVALGIAGFVGGKRLAAVLVHRGVPTVRRRRQPAILIVEGAAQKNVRPF